MPGRCSILLAHACTLLCICCAGLLQPVSAANMGILAQQPASATGMSAPRPHPSAVNSSPRSTCSSYSQQIGSQTTAVLQSLVTSNNTASTSGCCSCSQQQQQLWGELRMPLVLGQPPADTAVFAPVMAALQDLQVSGCASATVVSIVYITQHLSHCAGNIDASRK